MSYTWEELEEIYNKVLEIAPDQRTPYIQQHCNHNEALKNDLLDMVQQADDADLFFKDLQEHVVNSFQDAQSHQFTEGTRIDKFTISEILGHGGMGTVYRADRVDGQFSQQVAIKIYSNIQWSEASIKRFTQEQQILASLNHPNIAQIYDGGFTQDGAAYFVMEYIDGLPIDKYITQQNLSLKNRIQLFKQVCYALEHAHKNLILHQDIKPNNILVSKNGHIKLLDFGISTILGEAPDDSIKPGNMVATPSYASPEQWNGINVNITSDIYQLGILLFKILYGKTPGDFVQDGKTGNVTQTVGLPHNIPHLEGMIKKHSSLPEDMTAIISKALNTNPEHRYQSAADMLHDIERYEKHFPVAASGKSKFYRLSKYFKRNKIAVTSLSAIFIVLMVSVVISMRQAEFAKRERDKAEQVADFLKDIFDASDPYNQEKDLTVGELLERGADKIYDQKLPQQTKAEFLNIIGKLYLKLGRWQEASPYFHEAYRRIQDNKIDDELLLVQTLSDLGGIYRDNSEFEKADSIFQRTRNAIANAANLENANYHMAEALKFQAQIKNALGQYDEAMNLINESIATMHHHTTMKAKDFASIYNIKASILRSLSEYDSAKTFQRKALDIAKKHNDQAMLNLCYNNMGIICKKMGNYKMAEKYYLKVLNIEIKKLPPQHPSIATSLTNIGGTYYKMEQYNKADSVYQKALNIFLKQFGEDHNHVVSTRFNMATVAIDQNNYENALFQYKKVLKADTSSFGTDHPFVADDYAIIGRCYTYLGQFYEGKNYIDKAAQIFRNKFDSTHQKISYIHSLYGILYEEQGKFNKASEYYKKAFTLAKHHLGDDHPYTKEYYEYWQTNKKRGSN